MAGTNPIDTNLGGRPQKLRACPLCHQEFSAREMRKHKWVCGRVQRTTQQAPTVAIVATRAEPRLPRLRPSRGGRHRKPAALRAGEGDTCKIGSRKFQEQLNAEPKATRGLPACPRHLHGRARAAWGFWATELADMNLDNRPDAQMLEGACVNYARAVQADLLVEKEGLMVEESALNADGEKVVLRVKYHPAITVSNAAWRQVRAFCSEFGLSPVARARLSIEKSDASFQDLRTLLLQPRISSAR